MSALGRKHLHRERINGHAEPTKRAAWCGALLLVALVILTALGMAMAGGLGLLPIAWERIG